MRSETVTITCDACGRQVSEGLDSTFRRTLHPMSERSDWDLCTRCAQAAADVLGGIRAQAQRDSQAAE